MSSTNNKNNENSIADVSETKNTGTFTDKPSTPVRHTPAQKATLTPKEPDSAAQGTVAQSATAQKKQISVTELIKLINAPKPEKPLEKEPVWSILLIITAAVFASAIFFFAAAVAYFYFRGAVMSLIITLLLGVGGALFVLSAAFMLRKIEKGIREIKTKL